ncbi:zeatin O-glucosyltransferase-like [Neltuma alba]|uniref:zeatin O-glucosyltransferase-like n=1 Tax=Neltuma alba TaxID=207710 RepID=UPI0010A3458B|nr:zeatin O-glucosyltransferase-like [Prosopis alba]
MWPVSMASSFQRSPMASSNQCHKKHSTGEFHQAQVVVVLVPFPAQGHLNQLLHLSRLILAYNIPVHYVGTPVHNHQATIRVHGWDPNSISNFHSHDFKIPPFVSPLPNPNAETKFPSHLLPSFEASMHLRQPVAMLLRSLSSVARRVIVIHDSLMASVVQDATDIANAETYTFHSVSAFAMFSFFREGMGKLLGELDGIHIPEVPPLEGCFTTQFLDFISAQHEFHKFSSGKLYNTTRAIENPYMDLIERIDCSKRHWAMGPLNPLAIGKKSSDDRHLGLEWLDRQEQKSVLYVSFGTTTTLTKEQIKQLAIGLEASKQKFIWVLRDADKGDITDGELRRAELPQGFEERVKGIGLIVRDWAPQLEILNHPSTGGFMSHCGWNSCMESITMGVPIAAWPMHSDQPRNGVLITEVLQVGLMVKERTQKDELVTASVVKNAVNRLMATSEGDEMRKKAMNMKKVIQQSLEEGGVSSLEMNSFIAHITRV